MAPVGKRKHIRDLVRRRGYDPKRLAACEGKIRYGTYEEAKAAAAVKPSIVRPYKCRFCINYHIGRKNND